MLRINKLYTSFFTLVLFLFSTQLSFSAEYLAPSWGVFGNASVVGSTFTGDASSDDGFYAEGAKELKFDAPGQITVNATPAAGVDTTLRFVFEDLPDPNVGVTFSVDMPLDSTTEVSDSSGTYVVAVPAQAIGQTYTNLVLFIDEGSPVSIQDVSISHDGAEQVTDYDGSDSTTLIEGNYFAGFEGALSELDETNDVWTITFPDGAPFYAGFENTKSGTMPFTFNDAGSISFQAASPSGQDVEVRFKFEANPWPNNSPDFFTDSVTISSTELTTYTVDVPAFASYNNVQTFNSFLLYIGEETAPGQKVYRDIPVQLGSVTVNDDAYSVPEPQEVPTNGVKFIFQDLPHPDTQASLETEWVEIVGSNSATYTVTLPAYNGEFSGVSSTTGFTNMLMYLSGNDQAVLVRDVELSIGSTTFGGDNEDSLYFGNVFDGFDVNENTLTYFFPTPNGQSVQTWAGAALKDMRADDDTTTPFFGDGTAMNDAITITFTAALSDESFAPPPLYDGESAFDVNDGSINTGAPTESGLVEGDEYRWSAWVTQHELITSDESKGGWMKDHFWKHLADLPATWSTEEGTGDSILTLKPNTNSFQAWSNAGEDDGKFYLDQILRIEGDEGTSALLGKTVNFSGTVSSNTLDAKYTVSAFINTVDTSISGSSNVLEDSSVSVELNSAGDFLISVDIPEDENYIPSLGFILSGRNANPEIPRGDIQIKNIVANFTPTSSITDAHFTNAHLSEPTSYWSKDTGTLAFFEDTDGIGPIKGQARIVSTTGTNYIVSNGGVAENLSAFGMEAGHIYNLSFYMKRTGIQTTDMGVAEFTFYESDGTTVVSTEPSDLSEYNHAGSDGTWTEYTQRVIVPDNAVKADLKLYGGSVGTQIAFDDLSIAYVSPADIFEIWATDNGLTGSDAAFNADPDSDGIPNGLENFLGTAPDSQSDGMSNIVYSAGNLSMQHSKSSNVSSDVTATYEWSTDLETWWETGTTDLNGTSVTITPVDDTPSAGTTTATATVSGTDADSIFIKVSVSNDE